MVLFLLFILIPSQVISIPNLINKENSKKFPINELKLNNLSDKEINKQQHEKSTLNQQVNNKKHYYQIDNRFRRSSTDLLPMDELELPASNGNILQSNDIITSSCDPNCLYDESDTDIKYQNRNAVNKNSHKNKDNLKILSKRPSDDSERYNNFNLNAFFDFFNKRQSKKLGVNFENNPGDAYNMWDTRNLGDTLSQEVSGLQIWNSVNLSGKRERPNYISEPQYLLIRKALNDPEKLAKEIQNEFFVPPRGRRHNLNNILQPEDLFMPNRGKKDHKSSESSKKSTTNFKDILTAPDLFVPNRGKKLLFDEEQDLFYPNRGKKLFNPVKKMDLSDLTSDLFIPNRGKKLTREFQRQQRNVLDNLSQENQDTFYSARGRRTVKELKNINEDAVKKYWRQLWPFTV